jgi:hypothetical protein
MKVFISYASEDRNLAERVYLALIGSGHEVFFDRVSLQPAGEFNARIRQHVFESDLFIFLVSPDSVCETSFALTELKLAREKWPHPKQHVLPVMIRKVDYVIIPNYLKAVTVMEPSGDVAAEVSYLVSQQSTLGPQKSFKHYPYKWVFVVLAALGIAALWGISHRQTTPGELVHVFGIPLYKKSAQPTPTSYGMSSIEWNRERPGSDYLNFDLEMDDALLCLSACSSDPRCKAWTYVRRFLKKNVLIQDVGTGLIKMSYLGNAGWRSKRASTAGIAALPSVMPFW